MENKNKVSFTPGPWRIQDEYDGTIPIDGWDETQEASVEICRMSLDTLFPETRLANARLIAAAPEMAEKIERLEAEKAELLSALKECLYEIGRLSSTLPNDPVCMNKARAAIAKAKAE